MRDGRARIAPDIGHAGLEQGLGDGEDALAAEDLSVSQRELLDFGGKGPFHKRRQHPSSTIKALNRGGEARGALQDERRRPDLLRGARQGRAAPARLRHRRQCRHVAAQYRAALARHRLILWEPRGHARSESPEDPAKVTFGHWVLDLLGLLDYLGLERAVVGGPLARRRHRHALRAQASGAREGLVGVDSSSAAGLPLERRQPRDARAEHQGDARGRDGRHGRVRHRVQSQRRRAAPARSDRARGGLRVLPHR